MIKIEKWYDSDSVEELMNKIGYRDEVFGELNLNDDDDFENCDDDEILKALKIIVAKKYEKTNKEVITYIADDDYYYLIIFTQTQDNWKSIVEEHLNNDVDKTLMLKLLRRDLKDNHTQKYKDKVKALISKLG